MFLFSATFFPLSTYPRLAAGGDPGDALYHGVDLLRALTTGTVGPGQLVNVAYLWCSVVGTKIARQRVGSCSVSAEK